MLPHRFCLKPSLFCFTCICWYSVLCPLRKPCISAGVSSCHSVNERQSKTHKLASNKPLPSLSTDASWLRECESAVSQSGRLHCGDMSVHVLQHSGRGTVNISPLQHLTVAARWGRLHSQHGQDKAQAQGWGTCLNSTGASFSSAEFQSKAVIFP